MKFGLISFVLACVVLALGLMFPWSKTIVILGLCYGLASLGVALPARSGQVSFGHAMFACVAAYAVAFVAKAFPAADGLVLILAGTVISTLFAALTGLFIVRYRGIFLAC